MVQFYHNCYYEKIGNNAPVKLEDLPFDIPDNWTWISINEYVQKVTDFVASGSFASLRENVTYYKTENYALMVKTQDFQNNFTKDLTYTDEHGYSFLENSNLYGGELVLANVGSIGKVFIVPHLNRKMTLAPNSIMVRFFNEDHIGWFFNLFKSSFGLQLLLDISSATAIKKFNKTDFKQIIIPIPPLKEQFRIAEKVKSLEPLIAQYSTAEEKLSILEDEFPEKLKKSILQYAIEGKLVKQDPNDEPASVLLERIKAEKEKLIKEGKIKRDKNESYIYQGDDKNYYEKVGSKTSIIEPPFSLPDGYSWARLRTLCTKLVDGNHNPPGGLNYKTEYLMLSSQNINNDRIVNLDKVRYISKNQYQIEDKRTALKAGDILFTSVGTLGRSCIYKGGMNLCFQRSVSVITTLIYPEYLKMYLDSPEYQNMVIEQATGTAQKGFYLNQLADSFIAIPSENQMIRVSEKTKRIIQLL